MWEIAEIGKYGKVSLSDSTEWFGAIHKRRHQSWGRRFPKDSIIYKVYLAKMIKNGRGGQNSQKIDDAPNL